MENLTDAPEVFVLDGIKVLSERITGWISSHDRWAKTARIGGFESALFRSDIHFHINAATNRRAGDRFRVFDGGVLCLKGEAKALYPRQIKARQIPKMLVAVDQFHAAVYSPDISRNKGQMIAYRHLL